MKKKLVNYGGSGIESAPLHGTFSVKYTNKIGEPEDWEFSHREEAEQFYNTLNCEKSIWDISSVPELLDAMIYI